MSVTYSIVVREHVFPCPSLVLLFYLVGRNRIYVADVANTRVQSFPFTTSAGSPNGTAILSQSMFSMDSNKAFAPTCITFDHIRSFLYVWQATSFSLIIVNVTDDNVQIISNSEVMLMSNHGLQPMVSVSYIVIDEKSNFFYLADGFHKAVVKFKFGSSIGTIIAGGPAITSIVNLIDRPSGLTFDSSGYLYIVDTGTIRVAQLLNVNGDLRTIAGE